MTREEAKNIISQMIKDEEGFLSDNTVEAHKMAIKALEQEPCEDAISRQAVLDLVNADWKYEGLEEPINSLPPVNPQKPKTGHWIPSHIPESILDECSECGFSCGAFTFNYCPNCGAKMVEPQESGD